MTDNVDLKLTCGIVILNYNDFATTSTLLNLIKEYSILNHIIVVDNHSTDDSYIRLCEYENEKIKVLLAPGNDGYSKGNNIGVRYLIEHTDVDVIGISNSDVEFEENFVTTIIKQLEKRKDYSIITGLQLSPDGEVAVHPFWNEYTTKQWFIMKISSLRVVYHVLRLRRTKTYIEKKLKKHLSFFRVGAVEGSLFFIRRDDFQKIGFFDEGVWIYCEEDILAKKIKKIGKKIGVDPTVSYVHYGAKTTTKVFGSLTKISHLFNSSVYYFNHYQSNNIFLQILNYLICLLEEMENIIAIYLKQLLKRHSMSVND